MSIICNQIFIYNENSLDYTVLSKKIQKRERKIQMMTLAEMLVAVHTHTHTHTRINLIEEKRVGTIYSKSVIQKNISRLLFSKQKLFASNLRKLLQMKIVY